MKTLTFAAYTPLDDRGRPDESTPDYPKFGKTVERFRKLPPTPENVKAHAEAIFAQLKTIQMAEFRGSLDVTAEPTCPCISGTWSADGKAILRTINNRNAAALDRATAEDHRRRSDAQVRDVLSRTLAGEDVRGLVTQSFAREAR